MHRRFGLQWNARVEIRECKGGMFHSYVLTIEKLPRWFGPSELTEVVAQIGARLGSKMAIVAVRKLKAKRRHCRWFAPARLTHEPTIFCVAGDVAKGICRICTSLMFNGDRRQSGRVARAALVCNLVSTSLFV